MCSKTLIYGAEYFLIPVPKITKQIFKKINPLERRILKMLQKSQILNFRSYTSHALNGEIRKWGFWRKLPLFDHFCGAPTQ